MPFNARIAFVFACTLTALSGCAEPFTGVMDTQRLSQVQRMAVVSFTDGPGVGAVNSGNAVVGFLIDRLAQSGRFKLIERAQIRRILEEQDLQASDLIDPATAARIGKIAGVDAIVTGSVNQYDSDKTIVHIYVIPIVSWSYRVGASVRIVDVQDGEIIYTNSKSGSSGKDYNEAGTQAVEKLLSPMLTALAKAK